MQFESSNTLAPVLQSPLRKAEPLSISTRQLADVLLSINKGAEQKIPDAEAVRFYALNQMVGVIQTLFTPNEKLPGWAEAIVRAYQEELVAQHKRLVWYTFTIITREFRHLSNAATLLGKPGFMEALKPFHGTIQDSTGESALNKWLTAIPTVSLEEYCRVLAKQFDEGSYSGGYGGKPWGQIARTLYRYIAGETSAETFIDTAYTLAHNNGPMFNKGMFYGMYTGAFRVILDIQRSGQVCEGIFDGTIQKLVQVPGVGELRTLIELVKDEAKKIGDYVDWHKVESLGSLGKYPAEKAAQDKKYGKPHVKTLIDGKVVKVKGEFEVYPGQKVEIYERVAA